MSEFEKYDRMLDELDKSFVLIRELQFENAKLSELYEKVSNKLNDLTNNMKRISMIARMIEKVRKLNIERQHLRERNAVIRKHERTILKRKLTELLMKEYQ